MKFFLVNGADSTAEDKVFYNFICRENVKLFKFQRGNTALMLAVLMGHLDIVKILLEEKVDESVRNKVTISGDIGKVPNLISI